MDAEKVDEDYVLILSSRYHGVGTYSTFVDFSGTASSVGTSSAGLKHGWRDGSG